MIRVTFFYSIPLTISQIVKVEVRDVEIMEGGWWYKSWFFEDLYIVKKNLTKNIN
jgi:hypothetical protein